MVSGYDLNELLIDGVPFRLYRARQVENGEAVLVKMPRPEPVPANVATALKRERKNLERLAIGKILRPVVVREQHSYALLMQDPGGIWLPALIAARPELGVVLAIGIQLAEALDEIHRYGMIHNGIRPEAILCDPEAAHAWLIDFGDVTGGTADIESAASHSLSLPRLVYASPEQTGRMNRVVDSRSDFYSLGAVLYELLTGAPPFRSDDPLELLHWQIARIPLAPAQAVSGIPTPVSDIVMKLLAKTAEDRYRSAAGLREDLAVCAREWAAHGSCTAFALAQHDPWDQFLISQKLYGREPEVATLLDAFERICQRRTTRASVMLVAGYSGIGKTSLIQELYKPIVRQRGYFVAGKFDQVVRNIPFGALIQAFRALIRQLLTESEARLASWRDILVHALGVNGGVLAEVIPEIEFVIGKQPPPIALGPTESLNRFQLAFRNFVSAVARPEHPLVVFLDDLQWADPATLSMLEALLTGEKLESLFLIGAYRDHEVDPGHPLLKTLSALEAAGAELQQVALEPLGRADLTLLIRDTLRGAATDAEPLARLVLAKTGGNPFFVTQFLKGLKEEGYLRFDSAQGRWIYAIEGVANAPFTDNVIDLMTRKIRRLSPKTQRVLTLAACIGDPFDLTTLAVVSEQPPQSVAEDLNEALNEGLILAVTRPYEGGEAQTPATPPARYSFLHDRVQQSAYALIPDERKQGAHLTIGRLLRSRATYDQAEARLFDIVHHLNLGRELLTDGAERTAVAELNLAAGRRAKTATAYEAALEYLQTGVSLLAEAHWNSHYELALTLHLESAEALYLCGHFGAAESRLDQMLERVRSPLDRADVQNLRLVQYESLSRYADAIRVGHDALALCGLRFPASEEERSIALDAEVAAIQARIGGASVDQLAGLPAMSDPTKRMLMKVCTNLHTSCYLSGDRTLTTLNTAYMVRVSLTHGNCEESAYAYALYAAMLMVPLRREYQQAYELGELALRVNDRFPAPAIRARVMMNIGWAISLWRRPMRESLAISREAHRLGNDNGMFVEATYALFNDCWLSLLSGDDLSHFQQSCSSHVVYARRVGMQHFAVAPQIILQWGLALQGLTVRPSSLAGPGFDEDAFRRDYRGQPLFEMFYCVAKLALHYTFGEYLSALAVATEAQAIIREFPGTIWDEQQAYYHALTLIELHADLPADERASADARLEATSERLRQWAENSPENFGSPYLIITAELARLRGDAQESIRLFESAIAISSSCPREPALARELFGRLCMRRADVVNGARHLRDAHALYVKWGATAKAEQLERAYPGLLVALAERAQGSSSDMRMTTTAAADAGTLDLFSVMKAAQAIAGEIELDQLLKRLMRIALENAGAEHGSLILEQDGEFFVNAEGSLNGVAVHLHDGIPLAAAQGLPESIVNYVRRTSEAVVLADARSDDRYRHDPYVVSRHPRSVMCVPVLRQSRLNGILYLENNMIEGAFTPDRIQIMQVLSTNAAISLENAKLIEGLKREISERRQAQEELRSALTEVHELKNELEAENIHLRRDLIANVSHDLRTPLASLRGYLETVLMKGDGLSASQRRKYLEIAARQSVHLANMVDQLFDLAKLDFKGLKLNLEPLHLGELVYDVLQKFQLAAERKRVELKVEVPARVPFVQADVSLVERVLDNLIDNALNHTPSGGYVNVSVIPENARVLTRVTDTGTGISEADLPFVFERFYRADKSRATGGAGLGLAIAKRILELHRSSISVESKPTAGTCFTFALPVHGAAATFNAASSPEPH